ncbi:MAG: hypothetical protein ABR920_15850 [Terriglobales bacterium]
MAEAAKPVTKKPPKGGRKGGALFPKLNLQKALEYSKKLVAKTHTGAQPEDVVLPGVFGNSGPEGKVRASALKQFGLMEGDAKAYHASQLAKDIDAALPDGRPLLLQRALLTAKAFNKIFDTFHGDTVSKAQIAKRAKELEVHPESADECAQLFIDSAITAEAGTMSGDAVALIAAGAAAAPAADPNEDDEAQGPERTEDEAAATAKAAAAAKSAAGGNIEPARVNKPGLTVNLNVDSSSDPDKLEKQLKLLRDFGVI